MHISSWAAMTRRHCGRRWHCRTIRTFNLDYVSPPQATQWPGGRSKHIRQWLGCGSSTPRYAFPISKMCGALIGVPKTSRDTKKDCGEPGCPNDHRRKMLARPSTVTQLRQHDTFDLYHHGHAAAVSPFIGRPLRRVRPYRHCDRCHRRSRGQAAALRIMRPSPAGRRASQQAAALIGRLNRWL
jgi:hypothetical protein